MPTDSQVIHYHLNRLPPSVTLAVEFHLTRQFKVRYQIAVLLLRLTAWVLGCDIEIEDNPIPERLER